MDSMVSEQNELIFPHGERLVQRIASQEEQFHWYQQVPYLKLLRVDRWALADLECLATGVFSPLTGFMGKKDYESVLQEMRLQSGVIWPLPITLPIAEEQAAWLELGEAIALGDETGQVYAILHVEEKYRPDKEMEAATLFGTTDSDHPGVRRLQQQGEIYVSGPILLLRRPKLHPFHNYPSTPLEVRQQIKERGWRTVVGFQTRNPIHRAHEYLMKVALEGVDGLLLHPLVGETKADDLPASLRMKCYEVIADTYFPRERLLLAVFPANMRYAGPREALLHALARKNYGCTHFIVGRDHAGVGNYYDPYDAQRLVTGLPPQELGILPLCFEQSFYCERCMEMATAKTCPHDSSYHQSLSGTRVRQMLAQGEELPPTFSRPEVARLLLSHPPKSSTTTLVSQ